MSDFVPFDIQSEIMKWLPVKSLLQFRCVSKPWKTLIDSPKFIKNYHVNNTNLQPRLLVRYTSLDNNVETCTSIIDNDTFPKQKFPLPVPESLSLLCNPLTLASTDGLLCFYGDKVRSETKMAIIWNPALRKSVRIDIPIPKAGYDILAVYFGVCSDTRDPKLVKISVDKISSMWVVEVFSLSTRLWKTVYTAVPFKSGDIYHWYCQVFVNGVIYIPGKSLDGGVKSNFVISFDLKSEKFREVCLPKKLVRIPNYFLVEKMNESLCLLEYHVENFIRSCDVWTRKDGANKNFRKIYTVEVTVEVDYYKCFHSVLGFRNNGEVVIEVTDHRWRNHGIEVYEPLSGHNYRVGISGEPYSLSVRSCMETLLLLDESDSIIH